MITSEVQIVNSALIKLGAERIVSLDDQNNRARLAKEQFSKIRDRELFGHPWKFAVKRTSLAVVDPKPDGYTDWGYVFQLPADCLRILNPVNFSPFDRYDTEEGLYFLADLSTATVRHIFRQTDVTKFTDSFVELLACACAKDWAYAFTQSASMVDAMTKQYDSQLVIARSFNAQQASVQRVVADEWEASRKY